jgi:beta-carotene/zeaxanthin 4-ketolase
MGILIAITIIIFWGGHLFYILNYSEVNFLSPLFYFHILFQAYLYTGLFITGHDAMHGNISSNKNTNKIFGTLSAFFFAGLSYKKLIENHYKHHNAPGENDDPDFYTKSQNFWIWWFIFLKRYTTLIQLIIMAVIFNIFKIWFDELSIWMFWVLPAFLGTIQLFYFGTYLPHRYPHDHSMKPHNARTQKANHFLAMISCYFFGYHHEHHDSPKTPWWKLYRLKNKAVSD